MTVRILLVAEIEIEESSSGCYPDVAAFERDWAESGAQRKIDAFREAVLPSENYGVFLYRAPQEINREDYL